MYLTNRNGALINVVWVILLCNAREYKFVLQNSILQLNLTDEWCLFV